MEDARRPRRRVLTRLTSFRPARTLALKSGVRISARFSFAPNRIIIPRDCEIMAQIQYMSAEGLEKLKQELHELKTVKRRELVSRIEAAKALGDLSENAEYHEAKDALGFVEGRILEIEDLLKNVEVIEEGGTTTGIVRVGSTVTVTVNGKQKTYTIVGSSEADPVAGLISNESPIGSALLGAKAGQTVDVATPAGRTSYRVVEVK